MTSRFATPRDLVLNFVFDPFLAQERHADGGGGEVRAGPRRKSISMGLTYPIHQKNRFGHENRTDPCFSTFQTTLLGLSV